MNYDHYNKILDDQSAREGVGLSESSPPIKIKVGDVVRLKSGGPEMTVTKRINPNCIQVQWIGWDGPHTTSFPECCLVFLRN